MLAFSFKSQMYVIVSAFTNYANAKSDAQNTQRLNVRKHFLCI